MPVSSSTAFSELASQMRGQINRALESYAVFSDRCPPRLSEAFRYSLLGSGKRLRPLLVLLAAEACGASKQSALPAACAVEMVHAYSLVHDDLPAMDNDDLRRGLPTCHRAFDEATAILAGDALLTRAFEIMAMEVQPRETALACCIVLARAAGAEGMVGGQMSDITVEKIGDGPGGEFDLAALEAIHCHKTGALFAAALRIGGLIACATEEELAILKSYGEKIGLAFQIVDDLLDVAGEEALTGKRVRKDDQCGKLTFPSLLGMEESRHLAERMIEQACVEIRPLESRATQLETLARYVIERDS
jgi:geranylgeranyl diphosphate synthase type II